MPTQTSNELLGHEAPQRSASQGFSEAAFAEPRSLQVLGAESHCEGGAGGAVLAGGETDLVISGELDEVPEAIGTHSVD